MEMLITDRSLIQKQLKLNISDKFGISEGWVSRQTRAKANQVPRQQSDLENSGLLVNIYQRCQTLQLTQPNQQPKTT